MAAQSKTTEQYSTLEWIRDDVTINAPELDHAIAAPELDSAVLAPQAVFHTGPELAYDDSPPEALDSSEDDNENQTSSTVRRARRLSKRIVIITLVSIAVVAAAIGVGIYFGRRAEAHTSSSKEFSVTSQKFNATSQDFNATSQGSNATFPPSNAPLAKHGILNDSSLAALSLPNGDRRLFYQEPNGRIKQAAYSSSSKEWPSTSISVVASDARNNTPLAAMNLVSTGDPLALEIYLFYVSTNGSLAIASFARGAWAPIGHASGISQFVAGTDSRSLSATQIPDSDSIRMILIYQNSDGLMMIMEGNSSHGLDSSCNWQNLTSELHSSIPSIRPRSRFSSLYHSGYLAMLFYDNESTTQTFVGYSNGSFFD
ncbi:hypothetical protein MMC22_001592, partial [Lobaria immixta]|nr:hypothetical protein [Lobaria immixta]